jgi:hypothetical protein
MFTCKTTGKKYIGSSLNLKDRIARHRRYSFREEAFSVEILETCSDNLLQERENYYIFQHGTLDPTKGYNKAQSTRKPKASLNEAQLIAKYNRMMAFRHTEKTDEYGFDLAF